MNTIKIALADDHILFREGIVELIKSFGEYDVIIEASNGKELIDALHKSNMPKIVLLDINMPEMDGFETAIYLKANFPDISTVALSMSTNENAIIRMVRAGIKGYLLKDIRKHELKKALEAVVQKGFYYTDLITGKLINTINKLGNDEESFKINSLIHLSDREIDFLKLASTEMIYKAIAEKMNVSTHTIDSYRDNLFEKLQVKSRVGLVLYAIKNNIVHV